MEIRSTFGSAPSQEATINSFGTLSQLGELRNEFKDGVANPLAALVSDEIYSMLRSNDLLNEKSLRDYIIRQMFLKLKADGEMRTGEAIKALMAMYPYLQFDTIRKIVYRVYPTSSRKSMM